MNHLWKFNRKRTVSQRGGHGHFVELSICCKYCIFVDIKDFGEEMSSKKHGDDQYDEGKTCAYDPNFLSSAVGLILL